MKFIAVLLIHFLAVPLHAAMIHVNQGQSIKSAIQQARSGDTVLVYKGNYAEGQITIEKSIFLLGLNRPVLDGQLKSEVLTIHADRVTVKGFRIVNSGRSSLQDLAGIRILDCSYVNVEDNILDNTFFGIYSQYGRNCSIRNNRLTSTAEQEQKSGNGIHCWKSDKMTILHNDISGHRDGIYFEFVTHSLIASNHSHNNLRYGLHFMFSNEDDYENNIFFNNGAGVAVMFSKNVKMQGNQFRENWGDAAYGILLKEISDGEIRHNTFENNTSAIYMEGANRIRAEKNNFRNNGFGIKIQSSCLDIHVHNNNFIGNTFDISTNGTLQVNDFTGNYWDKYEGYDLDKNSQGDVPYHPVSMFSMIVEKYPASMLMFRSFITTLLDRTEKLIPSIIPENLVDNSPSMKQITL